MIMEKSLIQQFKKEYGKKKGEDIYFAMEQKMKNKGKKIKKFKK